MSVTIKNETPGLWRIKTGECIPLSDSSRIDNVYLQNILNYAEQRFMLHNNMSVKFSLLADEMEESISSDLDKDERRKLKQTYRNYERKAKQHYNKSELFREKIMEIKREGVNRSLSLLSLRDKNPNKYEILAISNLQLLEA
jgi:D-ribose pyranose/furanose isomerase RbsD